MEPILVLGLKRWSPSLTPVQRSNYSAYTVLVGIDAEETRSATGLEHFSTYTQAFYYTWYLVLMFVGAMDNVLTTRHARVSWFQYLDSNGSVHLFTSRPPCGLRLVRASAESGFAGFLVFSLQQTVVLTRLALGIF